VFDWNIANASQRFISLAMAWRLLDLKQTSFEIFSHHLYLPSICAVVTLAHQTQQPQKQLLASQTKPASHVNKKTQGAQTRLYKHSHNALQHSHDTPDI
jgi:hypothetical protein